MKTWRLALGQGLISGSIASLVSTLVLGWRGRRESRSAYAPVNATSHWFWGEPAFHKNGPSTRHTVVGYAIHHASVTLWAVLYEKWFGLRAERAKMGPAAAAATAVAALACFCDYRVVPPRFTPGFQRRLSSTSLFLVYAGFGAGLLIRGLAHRHYASAQQRLRHGSQHSSGNLPSTIRDTLTLQAMS